MSTKPSCVERERPADVDNAGPDSLNNGSASEEGYVRTLRRRNPSRRDERYLWQDVFQTAFNTLAASHKENLPNLHGDVTQAASVADYAVTEWQLRWQAKESPEAQ